MQNLETKRWDHIKHCSKVKKGKKWKGIHWFGASKKGWTFLWMFFSLIETASPKMKCISSSCHEVKTFESDSRWHSRQMFLSVSHQAPRSNNRSSPHSKEWWPLWCDSKRGQWYPPGGGTNNAAPRTRPLRLAELAQTSSWFQAPLQLQKSPPLHSPLQKSSPPLHSPRLVSL